MSTGLNAQIGYNVESTPGTYTTVDTFFEFVPPLGLTKTVNRVKSNGIRANRVMSHEITDGPWSIGGPVTHELVAESTGLLMEATIDGDPATTGDGPYAHVFQMGDVNSICAQVGLPSTSAVHPVQFAGMKAAGWSLTNDANGVHPLFTVDWLATTIDYDGTPSLATASYASFTRFAFTQAVLSVASTAVCMDSFSLAGTTGYVQEFRNCGPVNFRNDKPTVQGSAVVDLANLAQWGRLDADTEAAVSITYTSGTASLVFAGNVAFMGSLATVQDTGKTKETVEFEFTSITSDAAAFTATLTNADSAA